MASVTSKNTTKARKRSTLLTINVPVSSETNEYISSYSSACAYKGTLVVVVGSSKIGSITGLTTPDEPSIV